MSDWDEILRKPPNKRTPEERARISKLIHDTLQIADDTLRQVDRLRNSSRLPEVLMTSIPEVLRSAALAIDYARRAYRIDTAAKEAFDAADKATQECSKAIRELLK